MIELNNRAHAEQIAAAANLVLSPGIDSSISHEKDGRLLGGVLYRNYTAASIEMHTAAFNKYWLTRDMLWAAFYYPFVRLQARKAFALIPSSNLKTVEFARKLGFNDEARIRDVFPDGDLVVLSLERAACRWLNLRSEVSMNG